tara:strand:- start:1943 stop:2329 length:387 start_codon:yes stop_codon:yes gene_type:complete
MADKVRTPIRIPQAPNIFYWLIGSLALYAIWSMSLISVIELVGYISTHKSGNSTSPDVISVVMFLALSYCGYLWRYTLPEDTYTYTKGNGQEPTLSLLGHIVSTVVTVAIFLLSLWVFWEAWGVTVNK